MPLLASIGAFLPGLLGKQVAEKTAKVLGIIILAILFVAILGLGKCAYDASVIEQHESADRAQKAERQLDAERRADEQAEATANELVETKAELDAATAEAARRDPEGAAKQVGPVSQSYYDTLRQKKENRR